MTPDPDPLLLSGPRTRTYSFRFQPRTLWGRIVGTVVGVVALVAAFAFSIVIFAVLAVGAVVAGGWLWWKTRHLRKEVRSARSRVRPGEREVRGEAVVVRDDVEVPSPPPPRH